jgi:hypothetical protein
MSTSPLDRSKEQRRQIRRKVRNATDVTCRTGTSGMGPNLAIRMLDISEEGVRLTLKQPVNPGEELEISFTPLGCNREVLCGIVVVWCRAHDGIHSVAGKFRPPVRYDDIFHII